MRSSSKRTILRYCDKFDKMVDQIMRHKPDRKAIWKMVVAASLNNSDMKKEFLAKKPLDSTDLKKQLQTIEQIQKEMEPERRTYAQAVNQNRFRNTSRPPQRAEVPRLKQSQAASPRTTNFRTPRNSVRCFNCQGEGHISRNCPEKRRQRMADFKNESPKCFGCSDKGHIRRDCPNNKCNLCQRNGHFSHQCYLRHDNGAKRANVLNEEVENEDQLDLLQDGLNDDAPLFGEIVGADQSR